MSDLKIGDIVWAKMKSYPLWPGQIVEPGDEVKKPTDKKPKKYIHFYGSENNAWIHESDICGYVINRDKYANVSRPQKGFLEAVEIADRVIAGESHLNLNDAKKTNGHVPSRKRSHSKTESEGKNNLTDFNDDSELFHSSHPEADYIEEAILPKKIIATPMRIGFLGLGHMGCGMVDNLLRSGHEVTVWNRTTAKCYEFTKDGALRGTSPCDVVSSCDITFSCLSDPAAVKEVVFGNFGVLQGLSSVKGKGFVEMSSVDVETITDINDAIAFKGGRFLEAPVIGNRASAKNGQLIILSAGDLKLYEDCKSCFQAMGKKRFHLGKVGNGTKKKKVPTATLR